MVVCGNLPARIYKFCQIAGKNWLKLTGRKTSENILGPIGMSGTKGNKGMNGDVGETGATGAKGPTGKKKLSVS